MHHTFYFNFSNIIKKAWEGKKSTSTNFQTMGLAYDPNRVLRIPNSKKDRLLSGKDSDSETDSEQEDSIQMVPLCSISNTSTGDSCNLDNARLPYTSTALQNWEPSLVLLTSLTSVPSHPASYTLGKSFETCSSDEWMLRVPFSSTAWYPGALFYRLHGRSFRRQLYPNTAL